MTRKELEEKVELVFMPAEDEERVGMFMIMLRLAPSDTLEAFLKEIHRTS